MKRNPMGNESMEQKRKQSDRRKNKEGAPGYGDKKLEGPNRPST